MAPTGEPRRATSRIRQQALLAIAVFAFLAALLEGLLQAGSYIVWRTQRHPVAMPAGRTALCVGDSWTFGMGSAEPQTGSYPARVQGLLRASGVADAAVVNGGQSGQNSRDVLERLPSQIAQFRPRVVCVLVGNNDYWSLPEPLPQDGAAGIDHTAYRFRWRLPRLFLWALGGLRGAGMAPGSEARDAAAWATRKVPPPEDPYADASVPWKWSPELQAEKEAGWAAMGRNDWPAALAALEKALALQAGDAQVRQSLAQACREVGRLDDATRHLDWLRAAWRESRNPRIGSCLAWALEDGGFWRENITLLTDYLERFPAAATMWRLRGNAEFQSGLADEAMRSLDRASALGFDRWVWFTRYKINLMVRRDLAGALRTVFACYVIDNDATSTAEWLLAIAEGHPENLERAREIAGELDCETDVRERLLTIVADLRRRHDAGAAEAVLADHVGRMIVMTRNAGAEPVVLCYPWRRPADEVLRRVAAEHGARFVPVSDEFARRTAGVAKATLRSPDGHCNDAGYAILAAIVADAIGPSMR